MLGIKELISDGLHISFNEEVNLENWLAIEFYLMSGQPPIRALAKVAWYQRSHTSNDYVFDVGIEFKDIRDKDHKTILDYINRSQVLS